MYGRYLIHFRDFVGILEIVRRFLSFRDFKGILVIFRVFRGYFCHFKDFKCNLTILRF